MSQAGKDGSFDPVPEAQAQKLPGYARDKLTYLGYNPNIDNRTEKAMNPTSESTKLEGKNEFHEYRAANKLEGAKALITGGE